MPDLFLIFNHEITEAQLEDARKSLGVHRVVDLPTELKIFWKQIPPDLPEIASYLEPVKDWLASNATKMDFVLIQGDFGACFIMVNFALKHGLIPVYSTTSREAEEIHEADGAVSLVHRFKHRIFRKYEVGEL